ncbi:MAG: VWA domain-containing protein [Nannocystaceae bacterium]|nr:VWA domain-containing protein [Nannocystaceae bacterium]
MNAPARERPALVAVAALAVGLGLSAALALGLPPPPAWSVRIPAWLAARLSDSAQDVVTLARPAALWLVPLAALPFLLVTVRRSLVDAPRWQLALQLLLRTAALAAVALALAMPSLQSPIAGKTVVFVVDTSASVDAGQLEQARAMIEQAQAQLRDEAERDLDREDRTRLGLVTYGARADVHAIDGDTDLATLLQPGDGEAALGSDHAGALRLGAALVDPQTEGRVVLLTDATGTALEREDLARAIAELGEAGLAVHTRALVPTAREDVAVEAVHLPKELRVGQSFDVAVDLWSTQARELQLSLDQNGKPNGLEAKRTVTLVPGRTQVKLPARVAKPGAVVFTATLDTTGLSASDNRTAGNDRAAVAGDVQGRPRVLLASTDGGGALASALRADHLDVDTVGPGAVPQTDVELRPYDLVIFSDVAARSVPGAAQKAVASWVETQGGGFIMVGGENSFGVGGWGGSTLEHVLPVRFEGERQREQPKLALVLVIDKSGSMSSEDRLDLVKEAARATASTLEASDQLGVIAFDSRPHVLVRLQKASNRMRIAGDIRRLAAGGGTNALPALREAYLQLSGSNALVKHVILLSDGQSPESGVDALLGDMRDGDITVSAVGVGAGAGKDFLRRVASRGRGRFYFSQDGTDVPRIFSRDTREATRNAVDEKLHFARVAKAVQALRGIDFGRAPGLRGIVPVKPKPLSELLLRTQDSEPLLVRGRRGLGQTAAFASDAKNRWAAAWLGWSGFPKLWAQLARDTMRQGATLLGGATIQISPGDDPSRWNVVVDVDSPEGFANELDGVIEVLDPALAEDDPARTRSIALELSAPGRYEAELSDVRQGQRVVRAKLHDRGQPPRLVAEAVAQVSVPYPDELRPEQLSFAPQWLAALPSSSHEGALDDVITLQGDPDGRLRVLPLWPHVLIALLLPLLLLDLFSRRVSLGVRRVGV